MRILFLMKYSSYSPSSTISSGLRNSVSFLVEALKEHHIDAQSVHVIDSNCIDKEVTRVKPDIAVLEAYWTTPEKMRELVKLHPKIKWFIRPHSNMPFLVTETIAIKWSLDFLTIDNVFVTPNNAKLVSDLAELAGLNKKKLIFLPNFYPVDETIQKAKFFNWKRKEIQVGCFGALRMLKNQVNQAIAALKFANRHNLRLSFHINTARIEGANANAVLTNLEAIFSAEPKHTLVKHDWFDHDVFMRLVAMMDVGMQVSFTETFNIVAADFATQLVPIVVSPEIEWASSLCYADPTDSDKIADVMDSVLSARWLFVSMYRNRNHLKEQVEDNLKIWLKLLRD